MVCVEGVEATEQPGIECVLQGERSQLMQFSMKVTVGVLFPIEF